MKPTLPESITRQQEIDAALVECLRILARRGRQLREERQKAIARDQQITATLDTDNSTLLSHDSQQESGQRETT